ncbi:alpha/beta hydrolase [Fulvivirgaceae bacterium BMA10]|uniref:Alpha/beta hydrolase n=1 Tax=Splendidivirga corallicola TaxID=3051826 RepID=A0ABT8KVG3_9BACT|nr:alpha/beta hydrolase [Fulvivirgaceae bacterium BMA10]
MTNKEINDYFQDQEQKAELKHYLLNERKINYVDIGADTAQMVVFVHGAPGSLSAFIHFMKDQELLNNSRIISVDRPGYGFSDFGDPEVSLKEQSMLLKPILLSSKSSKPPILVGHSLGGPIVARMAMDYPELVGGLILVAPSIDPDLEKREWYRYIGRIPPISWFVPTSLYVTNEEIFFLKKELQDMLPLWKDIQIPVTVIQGEEDELVPAANADFAEKVLINAPLKVMRIPNQNHFIPWNNSIKIKEAVANHLNISQQDAHTTSQ